MIIKLDLIVPLVIFIVFSIIGLYLFYCINSPSTISETKSILDKNGKKVGFITIIMSSNGGVFAVHDHINIYIEIMPPNPNAYYYAVLEGIAEPTSSEILTAIQQNPENAYSILEKRLNAGVIKLNRTTLTILSGQKTVSFTSPGNHDILIIESETGTLAYHNIGINIPGVKEYHVSNAIHIEPILTRINFNINRTLLLLTFIMLGYSLADLIKRFILK